MLLHDLRLAVLSIRRTPVLAALMIGAMAVGIGASMVTITLYYARSGHPIWWKDQQLFAVTLDNRAIDPESDQSAQHPEYPPFLMTYRDANAIYASDIPKRSAMMFRSSGLIDPGRMDIKPFRVSMRVTTSDFFAMFDVPFLYGGAWSRADDVTPEPVVVIARSVNDTLFAGANSIGRSISIGGHEYRVIGILDTWMPQPRFYDLSGAFAATEGVYIPFGWTEARQLETSGMKWCFSDTEVVTSFRQFLAADCIWLQFWAELVADESRARYQSFIDDYVREQKQHGRFPRPLNNRLANVSTWLRMNDVIGDEARTQVVLALLFLLACVLNTVGLMLAKFDSTASIAGLRRALGATRMHIMRQHLTEVVLIGLCGGLAGLALAFGGLWLIRTLLHIPRALQNGTPEAIQIAQSLSHLDGAMVVAAIGISLATSVLAGLYPAWRIGRVSPGLFLKAQ